MRYWPPYLGAGVSVKSMTNDLRSVDVQMKLRFWNRNYVGTHFGGSLYSMVDPFLMLMFMENLGRDYIVWDKAASIKFISPGRSNVFASIRLTEDDIEKAKREACNNEKYEPEFEIDIFDVKGELVAKVFKKIYIKKKD